MISNPLPRLRDRHVLPVHARLRHGRPARRRPGRRRVEHPIGSRDGGEA